MPKTHDGENLIDEVRFRISARQAETLRQRAAAAGVAPRELARACLGLGLEIIDAGTRVVAEAKQDPRYSDPTGKADGYRPGPQGQAGWPGESPPR